MQTLKSENLKLERKRQTTWFFVILRTYYYYAIKLHCDVYFKIEDDYMFQDICLCFVCSFYFKNKNSLSFLKCIGAIIIIVVQCAKLKFESNIIYFICQSQEY